MFKKIYPYKIFRNFSKSRALRNIEKAKPPEYKDQPAASTLEQHFVPGNWQRKLLVWSGRFKSYDDIPPKISPAVLNNAKSRMRIRIMYIMMAGSSVMLAVALYLGKQNLSRGDTILQRNIDDFKRIKGEAQANNPR